MKAILSILLILSSSSGLVLAQNTEFIAYQKSDPLPIVIGDPLGSKIDREHFDLPVHFGYPVRSYRILGTVIAHAPGVGQIQIKPEDSIRLIVSTAKLHGAEAVIMLRLSEDEKAMADGEGFPWVLAKALVIRWRTPNDS